MKKIVLLFILLTTTLLSSSKLISARYEIMYGSFLPLGIATANIKIDKKNNYEISIEAQTTGLANILSNNRSETYKSTGILENGKFIPKEFTKIKQDNLNKSIRKFIFKNKNKEILVEQNSEEKQRVYDSNFDVSYKIKKENKRYILDYYAKEDILSLFFNLKEIYPTYKKGINYELKALGANKTKGIINLLVPQDMEELNKYLKTESTVKFIVSINQKIFQSEKGELMISLDNHGFCDYAVLKDVLFFGDISAKMEKLTIQK